MANELVTQNGETVKGVLTVKPDGTNEVLQVNDGSIDLSDGNGGTAGTLTVDSSGNLSHNKNIAATSLDGIVGGATPATVNSTDIVASGVVSVDDTTDSSSTVTGSIHTDGGLGVAKKSFFGDDADFGGNYATQLQNVADLASKGPSYWFDGVDDYVSLGTSTELDLGTGDGSIIVSMKNSGNDGAENDLYAVGDVGTDDYQQLYITSGGVVRSSITENTVSASSTGTTDIGADNLNHVIAVTIDRSSVTGQKIFIDGKEESYSLQQDITSIPGNIAPTTTKYIGIAQNGTGAPFAGNISNFKFFNLALSAAEVKALSSGAEVSYKYRGASQTELIASQTDRDFSGASNWANNALDTYDETGDLSITSTATNQWCSLPVANAPMITGKRYRLTVTANSLSGDGFTLRDYGNVLLAADSTVLQLADGANTFEFTYGGTGGGGFRVRADGTGGITLDNFTLTQIGCVLDLNPDGIGPSQWLDASGNSLNGTVSGAKAVNIPVQDRNWNQVNLLTNSGFGVWSNSEDLYDAGTGAAPVVTGDDAALVAGGSLVTNGGFDSDTTGWTVSQQAGGDTATFTSAGGQAVLTDVGDCGTYQAATNSDAITIVSGKLYEVSIYVKSGTAGDVTYGVYVGPTEGSNTYLELTGTSAAGGATISGVFEATGVAVYIRLIKSNTTDGTMLFDSVTLNEVTPGIVSAATTGPDSWRKQTATDIWREHKGTNTKYGSFYALKILSSGNAAFEVSYPAFGLISDPTHLAKFAGRTVTFGCWVKTDAASQVKLNIYEESSNFGSLNTGSDWEWLELTHTFGNTPTYANFAVYVTSGKTAYISQPMLVFGSHIGEGNYVAPPGEIVYTEKVVELTTYNGSYSVPADVNVNLESESNGKIPKGCKAVQTRLSAQGGATTQFIAIRAGETGVTSNVLMTTITANAIYGPGIFTPCDANGDFWIDISGTITNCGIYISAVQVTP